MDKQTLAQKLAALSSDGETFADGMRVISDGIEPPILTAILNEVDMTVLPRKLTFRMGPSEITLVAAGRRLRGLVRASKDIKGVIGVLGKPLTPEDTELLDGLHSIIDQFTTAAGQMTVESNEPDAMGGQSDAGMSSQALAGIWEVSMMTESQTEMVRFIRSCGSSVTAWIVMTAKSDNKTGGDGAKLAALKAALSDKWADFSKSVSDLTDNSGFICLNNALKDHGSVAIVKTPKEAALMCYDDENMTQLHAAWVTHGA